MADPRTLGQNGFAPQYEQQQQFIDPSALQHINPSALQQPQQIQSHGLGQAQNSPRPYTLDEALPYTPFTTVFPFESGKCDCLQRAFLPDLASPEILFGFSKPLWNLQSDLLFSFQASLDSSIRSIVLRDDPISCVTPTCFLTTLYDSTDIINNPTIGSGLIAPSIVDLAERDDYDALNKEAENPGSSKRLEGSLEYVQNLLKPEKITLL